MFRRCINFDMTAPWLKRLDTRLPTLGSRVRCGFLGGRNGVWVGFLQFFPATNFIPLFSHTHLIHIVLFHFIRPCEMGGSPGDVGEATEGLKSEL